MEASKNAPKKVVPRLHLKAEPFEAGSGALRDNTPVDAGRYIVCRSSLMHSALVLCEDNVVRHFAHAKDRVPQNQHNDTVYVTGGEGWYILLESSGERFTTSAAPKKDHAHLLDNDGLSKYVNAIDHVDGDPCAWDVSVPRGAPPLRLDPYPSCGFSWTLFQREGDPPDTLRNSETSPNKPLELPLPADSPFLGQPRRIVGVSCGVWHSMVLDEYGNVYGIGEPSDGQLLDVPSSTGSFTALPSSHWKGEPVVAISCGGYHSVVVTETATWAFGQSVGLGVPRNVHRAEQVGPHSGVKWVNVASGEYFTFLVAETGHIWMFGDNADIGVLGVRSDSPFSQPTRLPLPDGLDIVEIGCYNVLAAVLTRDGDVYAWGELPGAPCARMFAPVASQHSRPIALSGNSNECHRQVSNWSPDAHRLFPSHVRRRIVLLWLMHAREGSLFAALPRDLLFLLAAYVATDYSRPQVAKASVHVARAIAGAVMGISDGMGKVTE